MNNPAYFHEYSWQNMIELYDKAVFFGLLSPQGHHGEYQWDYLSCNKKYKVILDLHDCLNRHRVKYLASLDRLGREVEQGIV